MARAVGIDLGTTNSAVAHLDRHGRPVIVANALGDAVTPSVICFRDGEAVFGQEAKELQAAGEPKVAAFFKRQMGVANFVFHVDGKDLSATDLSAMLLAHLRQGAERSIGAPVTHAVITVPAYFRNPQREQTIAAGRQAGMEVLQVINEPTAAAIAFGLRGAQREQTLLVYDLGGGTFDVTLLKLGGDEVRILTSGGDHELGGKDWDDRIVEFLASRFAAEHGSDPLDDLESLSDLLVRAEEVKKRLSTAQAADISIIHGGDRGRYTLTRSTLEEISADLMERTIALTDSVLEEVGVQRQKVDGVLLVGGSTRMPMVSDFVRRHFGCEPMTGVDVDEAVALGAAVVAAERLAELEGSSPTLRLAGAVRAIDVTNHSLGMIAINEDHSAYVNSIILPKNRPIPCVETRPYQHRTRAAGGNRLEIFMTQGEADSPADVSYLGMYVLDDVPHQSGMTVVEVEYSYDLSGTVHVTGRVQGTGVELPLRVEPLPDDVPDRFLVPPVLEVEPVHVTAYLAFDLSGSMSGQPLAEAKRAAHSFVHNTDLSHCSLGIIAFADSVAVKLEASQNGKLIMNAIEGLTVGEAGYGNMTDPFGEVYELMRRVDGPRFVITLADGVWANQARAVERAQRCIGSDISSIAIGFGHADRDFLRRIASCDEASFFTSMSGLVDTFTNIAQVLTQTQGGTSAPAASASGSSFLSFLRGR